jgi:Ca-activated chloride channel family protein
MITRFADPWLLALAIVVLAVVAVRPFVRRPAVVRFSALPRVEASGATVRQRLHWAPMVLRCIAMIALVAAVARPQEGSGEVRTQTRGVAIMAALDRSGSMGERMELDGQIVTRLDATKQVFREFVEGSPPDAEGPKLPGREGDLIGLVQFGGIAETLCPLARVHTTLVDLAADLTLASTSGLDPEAGTAIGDALRLAAVRLRIAEQEIAGRAARAETDETTADDEALLDDAEPDFVITSKVIVLITDGDETRSEIPARVAAQQCAEWGIKVYAIGIGATPPPARRGVINIAPTAGYDERLLRDIAEMTGGRFFRASDAESLREIYAEIDELETTEIRSIEYTNYTERFTALAMLAGLLLAAEALLAALVFRRAS